jgi:hypothetical protein
MISEQLKVCDINFYLSIKGKRTVNGFTPQELLPHR